MFIFSDRLLIYHKELKTCHKKEYQINNLINSFTFNTYFKYNTILERLLLLVILNIFSSTAQINKCSFSDWVI